MRILTLTVVLGALTVAPVVGAAKAPFQSSQSTRLPATPTMPSLDGRDPKDPPDPYAATRQAQMARAASKDRQKRIVDDTTRLLTLATELKRDVDKTTKDEMSLEVIRKADEIERLAHDVKQRMKG